MHRIGLVLASLSIAAGTAGIAGTASASPTGHRSSAATGTLSPDEFAEKGNAICRKGGEQVSAWIIEQNWDLSMLSPAQQQQYFKKVMAIFQRSMRKLGALKAPADRAAQFRTVMQGANETLRSTKAAGAEAFFGNASNPDGQSNPFGTLGDQLVSLGLTDCYSDV